MTLAIPEYGTPSPGAAYVLRPGGYAVIFGTGDAVAIIRTPHGFALPGGGQETGESPEAAAVREAYEECGLRIELVRCLGVADELVFDEAVGTYYRKRCAFFLARLVEASGGGEADHELVWLPRSDAVSALQHASQRWAVGEALRVTPIPSEVSGSSVEAK